jgi:hypothetical protein
MPKGTPNRSEIIVEAKTRDKVSIDASHKFKLIIRSKPKHVNTAIFQSVNHSANRTKTTTVTSGGEAVNTHSRLLIKLVIIWLIPVNTPEKLSIM